MMRTYHSQMVARPEQKEALRRLSGQKVFALLMAMRTGKTKVILDDFGRLELAKEIQDLLVIAPGGVYRTWVTAIKEHASDDLQKRAMIYIWNSKIKDARLVRELGAFFRHTGPRILLMNVEALSVVQSARDACEQLMRARKTMCVIDESTCIKNPKKRKSKRGFYIVRTLRPLAAKRRILSGLPTPKSPMDLFMQFAFLSPSILGFNNFYTFRARYAITKQEMMGGRRVIDEDGETKIYGGRRVTIVVGYRHEKELQRKIAPYSFRVPFRPKIPSTYSIREVEMTTKQERIYNDLKKFATAQITKHAHVTATIVITQMLKLHQVLCGHVKDEHGKLHSIPELRTQSLLELLDDYNGKAVIWCSYDYNIAGVTAALREEYGPNSVARFWGGNRNTREEEEHAFKTDKNVPWMVATPSAGGKGRTWDVADLVVYFSSTNDLEHRDQSEQRVQGKEKKRQVDYVDLIVPDTVEMRFLKALRKKINMASLITGDTWREWLI